MVQLPILMIATSIGVWLFYGQHYFDPTYWDNHEGWEFVKAGLQGSSFYKLPLILQWFTGNIGFHHIHHLQENIPNYQFPRLYREHPECRDVYPITLSSRLNTMFLSVWDEERERLISFRAMARRTPAL